MEKTQPAADPTMERVREHLKELKLPTMREHFEPQADRATTEGLSYPEYLAELTGRECEARTQGRIRRLMRGSRLPAGKMWDAFEWSRVPLAVTRQCQSLRDGSFLARRENVLVFGKPGWGRRTSSVRWGNSWCGAGDACTSRHAACWFRISWRPNGICVWSG